MEPPTTKQPRTKSKQSTLPDYQLPPFISDKYPNRLYDEMVILRRVEPFRGTRLDSEPGLANAPTDAQRVNALKIQGRNCDTSSIDVLIILMRVLITFDFLVAEDIPENAAENQFAEAAKRDVGRTLDHDLQLKYEILKMFLGVETLSKDCLNGFDCRHFMFHEKLKTMFLRDFWFYLRMAPSRKEGDENGKIEFRELPLAVFEEINTLRHWDGSCPLQDYLGDVLPRYYLDGELPRIGVRHEGIIYYPYIARPRFMRVNYTLASGATGQPFESIRTITLDCETMWEVDREEDGEEVRVMVCGRPRTVYILFAIIRCASSEYSDDIRTYWTTGREIVPVQRNRETAANKGAKPWSIEEPGTFMLFYFRLEAENSSEIEARIKSNKGAEYEHRSQSASFSDGDDQMPGEDLPGENLPGEDLPGEDLPGEDLPEEDLPGEDLPGDEYLDDEA